MLADGIFGMQPHNFHIALLNSLFDFFLLIHCCGCLALLLSVSPCKMWWNGYLGSVAWAKTFAESKQEEIGPCLVAASLFWSHFLLYF